MKLKGIGASDGIAISKVFKLEETVLDIKEDKITDVEKELEKLSNAIAKTIDELTILREKTAQNIDEEHAMIFDAHKQIASDPEIERQVKDLITNDYVNSAYAFKSVSEMFANMFENMDNAYMQERAGDVRDVARRIISHLLGVTLNDPTLIDEEVIVVSNDLTPSDTAQLNRNYVKGFITNIGGRTSHSAIMARSLEIPAIVGTKNIMDSVDNGDYVILDGLDGVVIINPTNDQIVEYKRKHLHYLEKVAVWNKFVSEPSVTEDGKKS
jgi:phosphotransferase system enzyme I (PtsI)